MEDARRWYPLSIPGVVMTASDYIERLVKFLTSAGVTVHKYYYQLPHYGGQYRSETKEIFVNEPNADAALMVLAHEAGHWLGYETFGEMPHAYQRERQAYVYGWRVLVLIGADRYITRKRWIAECWSAHQGFKADTECV